MTFPRKRPWLIALAIFIVLSLSAGVFAANNLVLNSGDAVNLGAGSQKVDPCDNDVNVSAISFNDGENVYLQGFQYDNVDKPSCVGYDFETRFVSNLGDPVNLFATSSISSIPTFVRVFSPSSTANWQLGHGAVPTLEATVTQISASSFKVIFTTPVALASDLGRVVMAEMSHLPIFTYNAPYLTLTTTGSKYWSFIASPAAGNYFYIVDSSATANTSNACVYKSTNIGNSLSGVSLNRITALPCSEGNYLWQGLATSDSGQYVMAVGENNRAYFSKDYGSNWDSLTVSSYITSGSALNEKPSMSADGQIVCMISGRTTANIWKNGSFWNKGSSFANFTSANAFKSCSVSPDGTRVLLANADGLRKIVVSSLTSGTNSISPVASGLYGSALSSNGKYQVYSKASGSALEIYYSSDFGSTFAKSSGIPQTLNGFNMNNFQMHMSRDGRVVAAALYASASQNGGVYVSNDFGATFVATSLSGLFSAHLGVSSDLSRIFSDDNLAGNKIYMINSE